MDCGIRHTRLHDLPLFLVNTYLIEPFVNLLARRRSRLGMLLLTMLSALALKIMDPYEEWQVASYEAPSSPATHVHVHSRVVQFQVEVPEIQPVINYLDMLVTRHDEFGRSLLVRGLSAVLLRETRD